jgi:hypothetical protein
VDGVAGSVSGEHRGAGCVLREVPVGSDRDRRRAAAGRTLVVDGGTSATPRGAAAGLSDEALVDGEVSAGVQQLDGA